MSRPASDMGVTAVGDAELCRSPGRAPGRIAPESAALSSRRTGHSLGQRRPGRRVRPAPAGRPAPSSATTRPANHRTRVGSARTTYRWGADCLCRNGGPPRRGNKNRRLPPARETIWVEDRSPLAAPTVAAAASSPVLQLIGRVVEGRRVRGLPDPELLRRFSAQRDEAAFHALLRRHGPMVLDVCRGVLGDGPDAEDAFQATFLVL